MNVLGFVVAVGLNWRHGDYEHVVHLVRCSSRRLSTMSFPVAK